MPPSDSRQSHVEAAPFAERSALRRASYSTFTALAATFVLLVSVSVIGWLVVANRDAADRTARTTAMIAAGQRLVTAVTTAQSSVRGYVLTDDPAFLAPYRQAFGNLDGFLGELRLTYREADRSGEDIALVTETARQEIDHAEAIIAARKTQGYQAAVRMVRSGEGEGILDKLRGAVSAQIEKAQSEVRSDVVAVNNNNWTQLFAVLAATLAAGALCFITFRRQGGTSRRDDVTSLDTDGDLSE